MCSNPHDSKLKKITALERDKENTALPRVKTAHIQLEKNRKYSLEELASDGQIGFFKGELRSQKGDVPGEGDSTRHTGELVSPLI